jgi:hypothetical protein
MQVIERRLQPTATTSVRVQAIAGLIVALVSASMSAAATDGILGTWTSWYGIVPGISKEPNVIALYGAGWFRDTIGDTGSRTYVSADGRSTLIFVFGFDKVVDRIIWEVGVDPAITSSRRAKIRITFEPRQWYGWSPALVAGVSKQQIVKWLGKPAEPVTSDQWSYLAYSEDCDGADLRLRFRSGLVVYAEFVAPPDE